MKLVSIIVPIYNTSKYLNRCLDSILDQTYTNLEILLINDGSTDNSLQICKYYEEKDKRIKIFDINNSGPSTCRNIGLKHSKGEFISFIDSDDYIEKNFIEEMLYTYNCTHSDIIGCSINVHDVDGKIFDVYNKFSLITYEKERLIEEYLKNNIAFAVWGKIFTKEILKNNYFDDYKVNEDRMFMWRLFNQTNSYSVVGKPLYHYMRRSNNSLTSMNFTKEHLNIFIYIQNIKCDIEKKYPYLKKLGEDYFINQIEHIFSILQNSTEIDKETYNQYENMIIKNIKNIGLKDEENTIKSIEKNC